MAAGHHDPAFGARLPDSLDAVLVHELIHIRRADYTWALLECLVSAAFAFHPLVWVLRRGIERCRETSCDAEVLAHGFVRPRPYAELLAHTHVPTQFPMPAVAASLSAPSLKLKERLETMKNFAHRKLTSRQRVGIVLGAGLVCVLVAVAGACATRAEEEPAMFEASLDGADREMVVGYVRAREEAAAAQQRAAEAAAHEADVARAYEWQRFLYTLTRGSGSNQYTYRATEEDVLKELTRLEVEMDYLREQITETRDLASAAAKMLSEAEGNSPERNAAVTDYEEFNARRELLQSMRAERLREYETVKMQYETQKRIREGR